MDPRLHRGRHFEPKARFTPFSTLLLLLLL